MRRRGPLIPTAPPSMKKDKPAEAILSVVTAPPIATEIARLCSIPAYLVSAEANSSMTYSNVLDERKQFYSLSVAPYVNAIQDRLSMDDITARGNAVKFDVDSSFLKTEPMERLLVIEKMLSLGLITVEQAMEMEDLTPNGSEGIE